MEQSPLRNFHMQTYIVFDCLGFMDPLKSIQTYSSAYRPKYPLATNQI